MARVIRNTFDQLYDGQRTGRYRWDQLHKTEKTHCGTLVEINLHREFGFDDGTVLDYSIAAVDVDCKYSQRLGGWMIPPEAVGRLCLVIWGSDEMGKWSAGVVRARPELLTAGGNRDSKRQLNRRGRDAIVWLSSDAPLPPNVLLQLPRDRVDFLFSLPHGTQRLNELFRVALGRRVNRNVVATVARQDDFMKRIRANGGSRTTLQREGIVILGQYSSHVDLAVRLGVDPPRRGESVAVRLTPASHRSEGVVDIAGGYWRVADVGDPVLPAPELPPQ